MYDREQLDALETYCKYNELYKDDAVFCKISKSSPEVRGVESYYLDYSQGGIVRDENPQGRHYLSFTKIDNIITELPYGDTLTILETKQRPTEFLCLDQPVKHIGNWFNEYVSPAVLVRENQSLEHITTHKLIISSSKDEYLNRAAFKHSDVAISKHFDQLGFSEAKYYWENIEKDARSMMSNGISYSAIPEQLKKIYGEEKQPEKEQEKKRSLLDFFRGL